MSFKLIDKIIDTEDVVKGTDKYVLIVMAKHANDDGTDCYPSIKTLARECGVTRDTIYEHLGSLIAQGLITNTGERKIWPRGHYTVIYQINVERFDSVEQLNSVDSSEKPCRKRRQAVSNPRTQLCPIPSLRSGNSVQPSATLSSGVNERESEDSSAASPPQASASPTPTSKPKSFCTFKDKNTWTKLKALLGSKDRIVSCWIWNQAHKSGKFQYQSEFDMLDKLSKADRNNPKGTFAQFEHHENMFPELYQCKKCYEYEETWKSNVDAGNWNSDLNRPIEAPPAPAVPPNVCPHCKQDACICLNKFDGGYLKEGEASFQIE